MEGIHIFLHNLHWFDLFLPGFLLDSIFSFSKCLIFKMSYISYITYITHFITNMGHISEQQVKSYCRACMTQMGMTVNCWSANIHTYKRRIKRFKKFFFLRKGIKDCKVVLHCFTVLYDKSKVNFL